MTLETVFPSGIHRHFLMGETSVLHPWARFTMQLRFPTLRNQAYY